MIALLQRVTEASVSIDGHIVASIGPGCLALVGVEREDELPQVQRLAQRLLAWRMFSDSEGKMNLNLAQSRGSLLLVPQFTLAADTNSGNRASFTSAAPPERGEALFESLKKELATSEIPLHCGQFGANMQVALINDGPVTFRLQT